MVVIAVCMMLLAYGFGSATYTVTPALIESLPAAAGAEAVAPVVPAAEPGRVARQRLAAGALAVIPNGTYAFTDHMDDDGQGSIDEPEDDDIKNWTEN